MSDVNEIKELKTLSDSIELLFIDKKVKDLDMSIELMSDHYDLMKTIFDESELEEDKQYAVRQSIKVTLSYLYRMLTSPKVPDDKINKIYSLYKRVFAFCGRRSLQHFIEHMESQRPSSNRVYMNRKDAIDPVIFYLNKMALDGKLKKFAFSLPPGYGKSFTMNYYSAWKLGMSINNSILRMSFAEDLLNGFSRSIKDLIASDLFAEIFPDFGNYKNKPFDKEKDSDWKIKNADVLVSHYVRTRDGAVTGIRAKSDIIFDDMTKGKDEAMNDDIHKSIWQKYLTEWWNRRESDNVNYIFGGTMWNPLDLINMVIEGEARRLKIVRSKRFEYAWESTDGTFAYVKVPLLNKKDESTCPFVMSTKEALRLREDTDPFLFSCVYQQDPIAPSGLEFAYENLRTYDVLPRKQLNNHAYSVLDPTRKGKDNVSMPICIASPDGEDHYLADVIYKKKAITDVIDDIVNKIIEHQITKFCIENNTDTSLRLLIVEKLRQKNYTICEVTEKFNTAKKEIRIKDARGILLKKIIFPAKGKYSPNSDMGRFMDAFTKYSFDYANKHDDAPDSLSLYVNEIILDRAQRATVTFMERGKLGI